MEFKVVNRHRHSANPLVDQIGSAEPLPSPAAVVRALAACFLFSTILAGLLLGAASGALGAPIPGLFNTGTDASGTALVGGNGVADPHYTVLSSTIGGVATGIGAVTHANSAYPLDDADSRWISHSASGSPGNGTTVFRLTFDLTGLDPGTAVVSGVWGLDNFGTIFLNGTSTDIIFFGFTSFQPFSITDGFIAGVNTLDFRVTDTGPPLALRVDDLAGTADIAVEVPAPGSLALFGLATVATVLRRRIAYGGVARNSRICAAITGQAGSCSSRK